MSNRHVPQALVDLSIKTIQDRSVFGVGDVLAPTKRVSKDTDKYYKYSVDQQFRVHNTVRANHAPSKRMDLTELSATSYNLRWHSLNTPVSERDRQNSDPAVNPDMDAVQELTDSLLREREIEVAKVFFTSTSFGQNLLTLSTNAYDLDTTTSDPIGDADTSIQSVLKSTGQVVNNCVMGFKTFQVLKDHSDVLDRIKWSERGIVTEDILASVLNCGQVTVGKSVYRTTNEGISATTDFVFDSKMLYLYNTPTPGIKSANLGITFSGLAGESMPRMKRWYDDNISADIIELEWAYDVELVNSLSGAMIAAVHS
jgi:hypothetical protein